MLPRFDVCGERGDGVEGNPLFFPKWTFARSHRSSLVTWQTLEQKKEWNTHFQNYIRDLDKIKPVVWTGDLNVAPTSMGQWVIALVG